MTIIVIFQVNFSKHFQIWLKLVSGTIMLSNIPSWYQKVGFFIGSQMDPQEIPCCNVMGVKLKRASPINFDSWIIPMFGFVFFGCGFQRVAAMKCNDNVVVHSR